MFTTFDFYENLINMAKQGFATLPFPHSISEKTPFSNSQSILLFFALLFSFKTTFFISFIFLWQDIRCFLFSFKKNLKLHEKKWEFLWHKIKLTFILNYYKSFLFFLLTFILMSKSWVITGSQSNESDSFDIFWHRKELLNFKAFDGSFNGIFSFCLLNKRLKLGIINLLLLIWRSTGEGGQFNRTNLPNSQIY